MKNKKWVGICAAIVCAAAVIVGAAFWNIAQNRAAEPKAIPNQQTKDTVWYQGKEYQYNKELHNILFMGIDTQEILEPQETPGTAGQADSILLLSLNQTDHTVNILQISRDTMTDVDLYSVTGERYDTVHAQIATQYAYSNGGKNGNWAMKKTVSKLLYDLPIDNCVAVNIESIPEITDLLGGVPIRFTEDYTKIDPSFVTGTAVTLSGRQAERFVRYRDTSATGSNNDRMKRQSQYIPAMLDVLKQTGSKKLLQIQKYMITDLDKSDYSRLKEYDLSEHPIYTVPGTVQQGEKYEEFVADDEGLYDLVMSLFYVPFEE